MKDECGNFCNHPSDNELFIRIAIKNYGLKLNSETDESYRLNITSNSNQISAQINAETPFGARHALETLSQLMVKITDDKRRTGLVIITKAEINDKPFYQHRGLLVDTARHFIPLETIYRILDGMALNKMNVFHWHITDSQSFPLETKRVPQMFWYGAFSSEKVYRQAEINALVKYAKYRGIRVIFELDAPGMKPSFLSKLL